MMGRPRFTTVRSKYKGVKATLSVENTQISSYSHFHVKYEQTPLNVISLPQQNFASSHNLCSVLLIGIWPRTRKGSLPIMGLKTFFTDRRHCKIL